MRKQTSYLNFEVEADEHEGEEAEAGEQGRPQRRAPRARGCAVDAKQWVLSARITQVLCYTHSGQ